MAVTTQQAAALGGRAGERSTTARGPMTRRTRSKVAVAVRVVVAVVVSVIMAFPLWVMIVTAVSGQSVFSSELDLLPTNFTLDNFARVFQAWPVGAWFSNSVTVTALTTIISVVVSVMAGYGFAKLRFPLKTPLFLVLLSTMMIPTQAILVPQFRLVNALGLVGTFWAVIIPGAAATFGIFLARQFIIGIPSELLDAARVDGAGSFRIFFQVVLPLCKPLIAALTLLTVLSTWNDFAWPLIALKENSLYTLPIGLLYLQGQFGSDYGGTMAFALINVAPMVVLFLVFQRYFVQGFARSGIR
jgi:ABC-type glycerol-3-phosphate transport system permease component